MRISQFGVFLFIITLSSSVLAAPIQIDSSKSNKANVKKVHELIEHNLSIEEVRFAILNGALESKNVKWILENEGDEYITLRWDYGEAVIYMKVEFNTQFIQLKYHDSYNGYECSKLIEGICYRNSTQYYSYVEDLRSSISKAL